MTPFDPHFVLRVLDVLISPLVVLSALLLKVVRLAGVQNLPWSRAFLRTVGVFPIRDHYYEPLFNPKRLRRPLDQDRALPGIDWNVEGQLRLLGSLPYGGEIPDLELSDNFHAGDAEFLYGFIRLRKPRRIVEIGSGYSTLIAARALRRNREELPGYACDHLCIEPYEMSWLEQSGVRVLRKRVEEVGLAPFLELDAGDLLFIDSSHVLRPQGDVVFEYLELLPSLRPGVVVHVHDIFSPRDYPEAWVADQVRLWNEQYVLEAFLSCNRDWRVLAALNFLHHHHFEALRAACPFLTPAHEPGSFYIERVSR